MAPKRKRQSSTSTGRITRRPRTNPAATPNSVLVTLMHDMAGRADLESENSAEFRLLEAIGDYDTTSPLDTPIDGGRRRREDVQRTQGRDYAHLQRLLAEDEFRRIASGRPVDRAFYLWAVHGLGPEPEDMLISARPEKSVDLDPLFNTISIDSVSAESVKPRK